MLALKEKEPVVLAAKPSLIDSSNFEPFHIPSFVLLTHADLIFTLGLIEMYLNIFWGALILEVCIHPSFFSLLLTSVPSESLFHP